MSSSEFSGINETQTIGGSLDDSEIFVNAMVANIADSNPSESIIIDSLGVEESLPQETLSPEKGSTLSLLLCRVRAVLPLLFQRGAARTRTRRNSA